MKNLAYIIVIALCVLFSTQHVHSQTLPHSSSQQETTTNISPFPVAAESNLSKIIVAALGGFGGWISIQCIGLYILRQKLLSYLIVVLNSHFEAYKKDISEWLEAVKSNTIKEGYYINTAANFTKDEHDDLKCVRNQCFKLLTKNELLKYVKLTHRLFETEALLEGLCQSLSDYKNEKKVLEDSDVEYFHKKIERINSYITKFPQSISSIREISVDFEGVLGPKDSVGKKSALKP
ncbi:hypothetical protein [Desulfobacter curvatus]|uniref:hypothetical protein n=1 Tax=Desulfobacter curvatus TaxID=2290 RepID=UPI000375DB63|nr:hypothetical protein [Desulfobacter curvatus]